MAASLTEEDAKRSIDILSSNYDFEYIGKLGCGTYGVVLSMVDKNRQKQVAVKIVSGCSKAELRDWIDLLHPNIIPLYSIVRLSQCGVIVFIMPYKRCTILSQLNSERFYKHPQSFCFLRKWMYELLCGLNFLHCRHLYHLDLKLGNELLSENATAMLSDFSFLTRKKEVKLGQLGMPDIYRPPEICSVEESQIGENRFDSEKLDLWAFGILCIEAFTKQIMYKNPNRKRNGPKNSPEWRGWNIEVYPILTKISQDCSYLLNVLRTAFPSAQFAEDTVILCLDYVQQFLREDPNTRTRTCVAMKHIFLRQSNNHLKENIKYEFTIL